MCGRLDACDVDPHGGVGHREAGQLRVDRTREGPGDGGARVVEGRGGFLERGAGLALRVAARIERRVPVVVGGDAGSRPLGVGQHTVEVGHAQAPHEARKVGAAPMDLVEPRGIRVQSIQVGRQLRRHVRRSIREIREALLVVRQAVVMARGVGERAARGLDRGDDGELLVARDQFVRSGGAGAHRLGVLEHAHLRLELRVLPRLRGKGVDGGEVVAQARHLRALGLGPLLHRGQGGRCLGPLLPCLAIRREHTAMRGITVRVQGVALA